MAQLLKVDVLAEPQIERYYRGIAEKVARHIEVSKAARAKGFDAETDIETIPTMDLADRTENIIGPKGVAKRCREIFAETKDRDKTVFRLFREIIEQKLVQIPDMEKRIDQAIRTALVLVTEGVVVAPLDGVPRIKISENLDGSKYIDIYYAGPIRAAGGTAAVFPLILGDYARALLGLDRFKPTDEEVERYVEECQIYEETLSRQYKLKDEEVRKIVRGCTVCINGEPTEEREVVAHRDIKRFPSNRVRGGMCLVISEGVALKAMKIIRYAKELGLDWSWLEEITKIKKQAEKQQRIQPSDKYLESVAAGRPIMAYPSKFGGFRLRYGRSRNTGAMGKAVHPATMIALDEFIAVGTQLKIERPGKAAAIFPCDSIEGPIVRLLNGSVVQLKSAEQALALKNQIEKILFLGDMLVSVGDFRKSAHPLVPVGYCEEWWLLELEKALETGKKQPVETKGFFENPKGASALEALKLSRELGVPLHPKFVHYYSALGREELFALARAIGSGKRQPTVGLAGEFFLEIENRQETKGILEKIGCEHSLNKEKGIIVVSEEQAPALAETFSGLEGSEQKDFAEGESPLEILSKASGLTIRDKAGTFIGARMGRPEQARARKMVGNPHILFPIGLYGGSTRSINKAMQAGENNFGQDSKIDVEISLFICPECKRQGFSQYCTDCNAKTTKLYYCKNCQSPREEKKCKKCGAETQRFNQRKIDISEMMQKATARLGVRMPELVKGVKGTINEEKAAEPLEKGILRAMFDMHVFRDATIRFEMLNAPLTHFKPKEIGTGIEKLKELGYDKDVDGKPLENAEQLLELFPQDVIINEEAGDFFARETRFLDELLTRFYGQKEFFRKKNKEEIIGELALGLAPHTSAAVVARIIGYTKARVCFAHPFFHLAKRRNIDGDQDSMLLLMDALLNFSQHYLPSSRGGRMDAPLVFTVALNPTEIDDEAHEIETCKRYPLELYELSQRTIMPEAIETISRVKNKLGKKDQYSDIGFTHGTSCFDAGPKKTRYVQLETMQEKIQAQARLQTMIEAVNLKESLELVLVSHFLPDIIGNIRAFSRQNFRCTKCNAKYRRIPLKGSCVKCGGNVILTIAQGSVRKYLSIAKGIIAQYQLSDYLKQRMELVEKEIDSVFKSDRQVQKSLFEFV